MCLSERASAACSKRKESDGIRATGSVWHAGRGDGGQRRGLPRHAASIGTRNRPVVSVFLELTYHSNDSRERRALTGLIVSSPVPDNIRKTHFRPCTMLTRDERYKTIQKLRKESVSLPSVHQFGLLDNGNKNRIKFTRRQERRIFRFLYIFFFLSIVGKYFWKLSKRGLRRNERKRRKKKYAKRSSSIDRGFRRACTRR